MFAPWLDERHPNPAKPGELRWFVTDEDGKDKEVADGSPVPISGRMVSPLSRTYIPSSVDDNPYYARGQYRRQLDNMIEPYRSLLMGGFKTILKDAANQVIPTRWVQMAQERWAPKPPDGVPMCAMGVDASGGGDDPMTIAARYDGWFAPIIEVPGKEIPVDRAGSHCAGIVLSHRSDRATVVVDMGGGYGGPMFEHLSANDVQPKAYKGAEGSTKRTADGKNKFTNKRGAALWTMREALDPDQPGGSPIALPPDPKLVADLTAPTFRVTPNGIEVESKEKVCARLGRSTDRGDAVVMSWFDGARNATHALQWAKDAEHGGSRGRGAAMGQVPIVDSGRKPLTARRMR